MTAPGPDALRAEVRACPLEHPEVLIEAMDVPPAREAAAALDRDPTPVSTRDSAILESPADAGGRAPNGDVALVEFTDDRCGYCRKADDGVEARVKSRGNIRFAVKELPILDRMGSPEVMAVLQAKHQRAAEIEITGAPAFVMQDGVMRGYAPLETMRDLVAEVRADG